MPFAHAVCFVSFKLNLRRHEYCYGLRAYSIAELYWITFVFIRILTYRRLSFADRNFINGMFIYSRRLSCFRQKVITIKTVQI